MAKSPYTLYTYTENGQVWTSAVHVWDIAKFLREHPDAKVHPSN